MTESEAQREVRQRRLWRQVREALVQGTVISLLITVALTAITFRVDDRRSTREQLTARSDAWRSLLLPEASFPRAVLDDLDLEGVYASGAQLPGASMRGARLQGAVFVSARLDGINAQDADFRRASFDGAVLVGSSLGDADLRDALLVGTDLRGADLTRADLRGARLFRADVRGTNLSGANLTSVDLRYVCFDGSTQWPGDAPESGAFCPAGDPEPANLSGTQYRIDATVGRTPDAPQGRLLYADEVVVGDGAQVTVVIAFDNLGVVPLQSVAVVLELAPGVEVADSGVELRNGNYPDGFRFDDTAVQANGRQVHLDAGDYNHATNFFVTVTLNVSLACDQRVDLVAYATPRRFGSVSDDVSIVGGCQ